MIAETKAPASGTEKKLPDWVRIKGRQGNALVAIITIVDEEHGAVQSRGCFEHLAGNSSFTRRKELAPNVFDVILAQTADRSNTPCSDLVRTIAEDFRPEFIILSGIAGGIQRDDIQLGDVVVADHVDWYEMRKMADRKNLPRRMPLDHPSLYLRETIFQRVRHKADWIGRIRLDHPDGKEPKIVVGNLIAGDKILGDKENEYQKNILSEFDKALAVDMESYGLARGVYNARSTRHYNLNYLIVRGISDLVDADGDNNQQRVEFRDYAAATAASVSLAVADEIVSLCS